MRLFVSLPLFVIASACTLLFGQTTYTTPESPSVARPKKMKREHTAPALQTPVINTAPQDRYNARTLDYGMTAGIERTPGGRFWACWFGGGDNEKAFVVLASSDDEGKTWSAPRVVIDPHDNTLPFPRAAVVANLWTDPLGRLWVFFCQSMGYYDGRAGLWASYTENPDAENPTWSTPVRLWHGVALQKPTVLSNGEWALIDVLWHWGNEMFPDLAADRGSNVLVSSDQGKTWERRGRVYFPNPQFDESMIVERKDGSLWMSARTKQGIWESFSTDGARTWSEPQFSGIANTSSRHFIRRLQSGNLLLVKNGNRIDRVPPKQNGNTRAELTAYLSDDDGKTWKGGLMLDERYSVTYPDGFQNPDGSIVISYDRERDRVGEILMARFTEDDILAGKLVSPGSLTKQVIFRPDPNLVQARLQKASAAKAK